MVNKKTFLLWTVIGVTLLYLGIKSIRSSIVLKQADRLNVVIYSETPVYYSMAFNDVSYFIPFQADYEMLVPGGYGYYRLGALGKLANLEKKPELIQKTFSSAVSSFVDLYFYPQSSVVYYGSSKLASVFPIPTDIFFSVSNASWLDRILILFIFSNRNKNQYKIITKLPVNNNKGIIRFDRETFFKNYQGFLYEKTFRDLNDTVQIRYKNNYKTAQLISQILEGEGIRIVDISDSDVNPGKCIIYQNNKPGQTAQNIASHLHCRAEQKITDISDIIFSLGSLEKGWSVE